MSFIHCGDSIRNIENNHFTGWIPEQLKGINLKYLQNNQFTGTLDVLANLPLQNLNIENNHFTGWIPEQLKGINLNNLAGNAFTDTLVEISLVPGGKHALILCKDVVQHDVLCRTVGITIKCFLKAIS
ncbi:UNVERIFIED_CONTAM: hypothetical protein Scaly_1754800 [Sesamum calycinum]|uniref:Uncharacterized protein n=1 Tax=Sesamum calycinum TaxID=2727403 RepID=A0AAW2NVS0_9LAMI